jgi:hypothetical protein
MKTRIIRHSDLDLKKTSAASMKDRKAKIVEKIAQLFKNKFAKLFADKCYTQKNLLHDLNLIITEDDLRNFEYNTMIIKIEKSILEILSKMETNPFKGYDMTRINSLINMHASAKQQGTSKTLKKIDLNSNEKVISNNLQAKYENIPTPLKPLASNRSTTPDGLTKMDKISSLKAKENDEWALIAKHNYQKHVSQEQEKRYKERELKQRQKEILERQIKEKEFIQQREKEEIKNFHNAQIENMKKLENDEKQKEVHNKEKVKKEKLMHDLMIDQSKKIKDNVKSKEMNEDKKILDKIKTDIEVQEERQNQKKVEQREVYKKLIKDNEAKVEAKKTQKEIDKLENQKALEEYSRLIEKQDEDRKLNFENRLNKMRGSTIQYDQNVKKKEEMLKLLEQSKLIREQEEKDIR